MRKRKIKLQRDLVAEALRDYANYILANKNTIPIEQAKTLDRALRSCKGIHGHDIIWPRWSVFGEERGWLTDAEQIYKNSHWGFPEKKP